MAWPDLVTFERSNTPLILNACPSEGDGESASQGPQIPFEVRSIDSNGNLKNF
jgi:hypothetical protein